MIKHLLSVCAIAAVGILSASAYELPELVSSVDPEQGVLSLQGDKNPNGVYQITVNFGSYQSKQLVKVNPDCDGKIKIYRDEVLMSEFSVEGHVFYPYNGMYPQPYFTMDKKYTEPGKYRVEAPEGMWILGLAPNEELGLEEDPNPVPSPALTLGYEIYPVYTLDPRPGVVNELSTIGLTFPGAAKMIINEDEINCASIEVLNTAKQYVLKATQDPAAVDRIIFQIYDDFNSSTPITLTEPGRYQLVFPEATDVYQAEYPDMGITVSVPWEAKEYQITDMPKPVVDPEENSYMKEFDSFTVTFPAGYKITFVDSMATCSIFPVNADGSVSSIAECKLKAEVEYDDTGIVGDSFKLNVVGGPVTPADGKYVLRFANGLFGGQPSGNTGFVQCPPFEYVYNIGEAPKEDAVEEIGIVEPEFVDVFNLSGVRVLRNASRDDINRLAPGFYIAGNKKVLVK